MGQWIIFKKPDGKHGIVPALQNYKDKHVGDTVEIFDGSQDEAHRRAVELDQQKKERLNTWTVQRS